MRRSLAFNIALGLVAGVACATLLGCSTSSGPASTSTGPMKGTGGQANPTGTGGNAAEGPGGRAGAMTETEPPDAAVLPGADGAGAPDLPPLGAPDTATLAGSSDASDGPGVTERRDAGPGPGQGGSAGGGAAPGGAGGSTGAPGTGTDSGTGSSTVAGWPVVTDYGAPGPFATTRQNNTGPGGAYDVFRPAMLGAEHRKHPIISWANGTLFSVDDYQNLLLHWASHGFVVIAGHTNTTAGGGTHKAGIDWLVAESKSATSPYLGVLDTTKIGAAGHSQGGGATIAAGANKPGTTGIGATLPLMPLLSFETDKTVVSRQLVPMLNINASMDDRDPTGQIANQIYDAAVSELVQASFIGVHEDAMNAKMHAPTVAWFRFHLMGDMRARAPFYPVSTCGLCKDAEWKLVRYKNPAP